MSRKATIIQLMTERGLYEQTDASNVASILNSKSVERRDDGLYNTAKLVDKLGVADVTYALGVLEAICATNSPADAGTKILLRNMLATINANGISFSSVNTRAILAQLVASGTFDSVVAGRFKDIGITYISPADAIGGDVTAQEVQEAIDWLSAERAKTTLMNQVTARFNNVTSAVSNGMATTLAEAISVFGA